MEVRTKRTGQKQVPDSNQTARDSVPPRHDNQIRKGGPLCVAGPVRTDANDDAQAEHEPKSRAGRTRESRTSPAMQPVVAINDGTHIGQGLNSFGL